MVRYFNILITWASLWIKITNSYSNWPPLVHTQSLSLCGHSSIELCNTSTGKSAVAFWRDYFIGMSLLEAISWSLDHNLQSKGFRSRLDLQEANLKWRWSLEHLSPATARLSVPCVLGPSPAGSSSSVHGRGCCWDSWLVSQALSPGTLCLKFSPLSHRNGAPLCSRSSHPTTPWLMQDDDPSGPLEPFQQLL